MVTIDPTQWVQLTDGLASLEASMAQLQASLAQLQAYVKTLQDYITNQFVFVVWGTLALLFIMAIAFYFMFRRPRR